MTRLTKAARSSMETSANAYRIDCPCCSSNFTLGGYHVEDSQQGMLERFARPHWRIAHDLGCGECTGTHYYARDDSWSFLDMILWSPARGANATWQIRANSVRVANRTAAQVAPAGKPLRHNADARQGVSDHWPLVLRLEPVEKQ